MHQILASGLAAVLSAIGFIVRRWIRKDRITEVIERRLKLVALHQKMAAAGLEDADLDRLERRLANGPPKLCKDANDGS
jgi:hypothetical protein